MGFMEFIMPSKEVQLKREKMYLRRRIQLLRDRIQRNQLSAKEIQKEYQEILAKFVELGEPSDVKKELGELQIIIDKL